MTSVRVSAAVHRALDDRQREATAEVERDYLDSSQRPKRADIDHLVAFCLRGLGV